MGADWLDVWANFFFSNSHFITLWIVIDGPTKEEPSSRDKTEGIRRWFIENSDIFGGRFESQYLGAGKDLRYKFQSPDDYWIPWRITELEYLEKFLLYEMGNGVCSNLLNTPECCFDGGDCIFPKPRVYCPMCNWEITLAFGDFLCDAKYNTKECCFDEGDCFNVSQKMF